jgi:CheY-like chemotaxis protein
MARLLIMDDAILLETLKEVLSTPKHKVRCVTSARAALEAIEADTPDLIIADATMPAMTGPRLLWLLEAVRARPDWSSIPFLFVGATAALETKRQITALETVIFLPKSLDAEALGKAVDAVLGRVATSSLSPGSGRA